MPCTLIKKTCKAAHKPLGLLACFGESHCERTVGFSWARQHTELAGTQESLSIKPTKQAWAAHSEYGHISVSKLYISRPILLSEEWDSGESRKVGKPHEGGNPADTVKAAQFFLLSWLLYVPGLCRRVCLLQVNTHSISSGCPSRPSSQSFV